ncbi:hypothetical protein V6N13_016882 [Hibiscus sabdariffa]
MLRGKALIKETDMPEKMQTQAMDSASQALDLYDVSDCISIAAHIKKLSKELSFRNLSLTHGGLMIE